MCRVHGVVEVLEAVGDSLLFIALGDDDGEPLHLRNIDTFDGLPNRVQANLVLEGPRLKKIAEKAC